jgi:hypothetical protein
MMFLGLLGTAEMDESAATGSFRGHPRVEIFLDGKVEMRCHFLGEVVVELFVAEQSDDAVK